MTDPIFLSYSVLSIKPIKLPVRERSREGERAFIEYVTLFAFPPGDNMYEDGMDKYEQGQCVSQVYLPSPGFC